MSAKALLTLLWNWIWQPGSSFYSAVWKAQQILFQKRIFLKHLESTKYLPNTGYIKYLFLWYKIYWSSWGQTWFYLSRKGDDICNGQYWRALKICESRESNWFLRLVHHQETHGHPAYANIFSAWAFTCLSNPQRVFQIINIHLFCLSEVREGKETIIALEDS